MRAAEGRGIVIMSVTPTQAPRVAGSVGSLPRPPAPSLAVFIACWARPARFCGASIAAADFSHE
jgi:hypothetical protein